MRTILIATRNNHKAREIGNMVDGGYQCLTLGDFPGSPIVSEDAATFEGNARKKASALARWLTENPEIALRKVVTPQTPFFILADDSGLEVDALNGAPGVHSARFAALDAAGSANAPDSANNAKLLRLLENVPDDRRTARFRCVLALTRLMFSEMTRRVLPGAQNQVQIFQGACEGRIARAPMGTEGFGYDPLFVPAGFSKSFGELTETEKNQMSHRALALEKLRQYFSAHSEL